MTRCVESKNHIKNPVILMSFSRPNILSSLTFESGWAFAFESVRFHDAGRAFADARLRSTMIRQFARSSVISEEQERQKGGLRMMGVTIRERERGDQSKKKRKGVGECGRQNRQRREPDRAVEGW